MMTRISILVILLVALLGAAGTAPVLAAGPKQLGTFGPWSAHALVEASGKTCYMYGEPKSSTGKYKRRDETFIQITHRPAEGARNQVSVTAGYTYRRDSEVDVDIDGRAFALFTDRDTAWAREKRDDAALVAAMKAGRAMIVRGTSARGTLTTDTYSLKGFTAAHTAIGKACGGR